MIKIYSTGRPVDVQNVSVGDVLRENNAILTVLKVRMAAEELFEFTVELFDGSTKKIYREMWDTVTLAQEEDLESPATAMDIFLALREKGAM